MSVEGPWDAVTAVVPAHDDVATLPRALSSIARQTLAPSRVIVVDDGSADATSNVARQHGAVVVHRQSAGGAASARNAGLAAADTRLCAFLDADDVWHENHLAVLAEAHRRHPGAALWFCGSTRETSDGQMAGRVPSSDSPRIVSVVDLLLQQARPTTSGSLVDREAALAVGGFDEHPDFAPSSCEDLDLWLKLAQRYEVRAVAASTVTYRVSDDRRPRDRLRANERARLRTVVRAIESSHLSYIQRRAVWCATFRDLGKWHLKHGEKADARRRFAIAFAKSPLQVDLLVWLTLTLLSDETITHLRSTRRRYARRIMQ